MELGQGSGDAKILTEDDDDGFILPIAIVCGSVLAVLVVVFGVYVVRTRAAARAKLDGLQDFEAQPSKAYEVRLGLHFFFEIPCFDVIRSREVIGGFVYSPNKGDNVQKRFF